jgi:glycosyltransferase involved in cell wall biosynthesis
MSTNANVAIWRSTPLPASETFVRRQAEALTRWHPTLVGAVKMSSPIADDSDVIAFPDGRPGRRAFHQLRLTGRSSRLGAVLADIQPAVIHAHFGGDGWLVSRSAVRLGIPLVITLHGRDVTVQPRAPGLRGARYRRNLRTAFSRSVTILAVSEPVRARAIQLGADPAKVRVHHAGVPIPDTPMATAKTWDIAYVGRFVEKKGIDDLIEAVGIIRSLQPRLVLIGDGPLLASVRERAAHLGVDASFLGAREPSVVAQCVAASRVFVAPSKTAANGDTEGLPTTILEAASLGVPTVSTVHSGIPEAVLHGETGILCAEGARSEIAAGIRRLLADDDLRTQMGRQARGHVQSHFDIRRQTRVLEDIYDSVVERSRLGAPWRAHDNDLERTGNR